VKGESNKTSFGNLEEALAEPNTDIRLFGKPEVSGKRRMGVALARAESADEAKEKAIAAAGKVKVVL